jgi:signal transduction histidine kinase
MSTTDKVNILLVDDQPGKLLAYEAMLAELGENLIKATSGKEALEHLLKTDVTVVLMDVSMPDLDGFELAEIIRGHPRFQKTAIIFVSAIHLTDLDVLRGYASGAVDYVTVPVVPELLRAKLRVFTELYRKTEESARLTRELEERVAARTAELEASLAQQAELTRQLREADRRKDEFLALLGHELRNPLAPVRNALTIMRAAAPADNNTAWCIDVIERQAKQLTRLVDDLLDVSRVSRGKITLQRARVDIASIVQAAVEMSRPDIDARQHEVQVTLPSTQLKVDGDAARLTQVVANLLNNAAKYQDVNGRIDVIVEQVGDQVELRVKDRGIGITPAMLSEIFVLFSQGERARDMAQGGLGNGLSLVTNLVEMHGGSVRALSQGHGFGSELIVSLPCLQENVASMATPAEAGASVSATPRRILVVDDNEDAADSLALLLRLKGHEVSVAHDGLRALELAASERPSVMLLDIGLPGMDGYDVCRTVRAQGFNDVRIIAMTGYGQERDRIRALEAGFDTHTVKPVDIAELTKLIGMPTKGAAMRVAG